MQDLQLKAKNISVDFSGLRALEDISLQIGLGEIVGLIGPNGSGKTTLVNVITGQVKPVSGMIFLGGENITKYSPRKVALKGVTRSFQQVRLFNQLTVVDNIATSALAKGASRHKAQEMAMELLEEFNLTHYARQLAGAMNYGDKRRIEILRALACEPRFLLLDEPAAGMNEAESEMLLNILSRLPEAKNLGMLIIDHDMPFIMCLCHRLHVISSGKTIAEGDVDAVRKMPAVIEAYLGSNAEEGESFA